jgi:hypothetical protein
VVFGHTIHMLRLPRATGAGLGTDSSILPDH